MTMETIGRNAGAVPLTPAISKISHKSKFPENSNPNVTTTDPKGSKSTSSKSATIIQKSVSKKPNPTASPSPRKKIQERKFVVAKKISKREKPKTLTSINCKCTANSISKKCVCVAYETLRASQDEFSNTENPNSVNGIEDNLGEGEIVESSGEKVISIVKRRREKLSEVAIQSIPENGCGRVMHLVKAFESKLTLTKSKSITKNEEHNEELEADNSKVHKWELPGMRPRAPVTEFSSQDLTLTRESLGLDSGSSCSLGSSSQCQGRSSVGGRRSSRNSSELSATFGGTRGKKTLKATPQQPFKLKTEQRGKSKQEEFVKRVKEMIIEQEKQRIRTAQGLPWTTDQPECLVRPPVKQKTTPVDIVLHSDTRALERAEFDHFVQEKLWIIEQHKLERERLEKLAEEEELKRFRKGLVPKAQPMPFFNSPFVPKRSERPPTVPKEPRFQQHKKMCGGQ